MSSSWNYYDYSCLDKLKLKFNNVEKIEKNYSQSFQDMFVLTMLNGKSNGTYVEIGSYEPTYGNNTYILEKIFGWKGISFDIDLNKVNLFNSQRINKSLCQDATISDYTKIFEENNFPKRIDYLQVDIEPAHQTLKALKKIDLESYRFSVITFETDIYADKNNEMILNESREIFKKNNYQLVASNVKSCGYPYEDWYIDPEIVPYNVWEKFQCDSFESVDILLNKENDNVF